jgi:hypothetical protein
MKIFLLVHIKGEKNTKIKKFKVLSPGVKKVETRREKIK